MEKPLNLIAYLKRIGYIGNLEVSLSTLQAIQLLHPKAIPFENLNPFIGSPVSLDLETVEQKLVVHRRGGYCFEQNNLLMAALQQIGFQVKGLAARVVWNRPTDAPPTPFSHMLLLVDLDGEQYLADVGFGGMTLTSPLLLKTDVVQPTTHEAFRLVEDGAYLRLETAIKDEWKPCYKFQLEPYFPVDYEVMNWYTSCHPSSHFTNTIVATRVFDGGRYALRNNELTTHFLDRPSEKKIFSDPEELKTTLEEVFGLDLTSLPKLDQQLEQLF